MKYILFVITILIVLVSEARLVRIGIMDSGFTLKDNSVKIHFCEDKPNINFTKELSMDDVTIHGNNILHIIIDGLDYNDYCVVIIKFLCNDCMQSDETMMALYKGYKYASISNLDILNFSASGEIESEEEKKYINLIIKNGTKVVVAAGNHKIYALDALCNVFPACIKNPELIVVGSVDENGNISKFSNFGIKNEQWENGENVIAGGYKMSGTSQAAAKRTRRLVDIMIRKNKNNGN